MKKQHRNAQKENLIMKYRPDFDLTLSQMDNYFSSFDFGKKLRENNKAIDTSFGVCSAYLADKVNRISHKTWMKKQSESNIDSMKRRLFSLLPENFETKDAHSFADELGISTPTINRYLTDDNYFISNGHGRYKKIFSNKVHGIKNENTIKIKKQNMNDNQKKKRIFEIAIFFGLIKLKIKEL